MIFARHKLNPPNEVMFAQLRSDIKRYVMSFDNALAEIIQKEVGINPFKDVKYRGGNFALARQLFMTFTKEYTFRTLEKISRPFGTSHDYVLYCEKTVKNRCETDKRFKAMYLRIDEKAKKLK